MKGIGKLAGRVQAEHTVGFIESCNGNFDFLYNTALSFLWSFPNMHASFNSRCITGVLHKWADRSSIEATQHAESFQQKKWWWENGLFS